MASEEAADWRVGLTRQQRFAYMFDGMYACDVTFLVGHDKDQEVVSCHKFPLIAGSAVFEHVLESKTPQEIAVPDIEPAVFKTMIKYLYDGELNIQASNVLALMHAANKYSIKDVTEKCGDFLKTQIKTDNVCTILKTSMQYSKQSLMEGCLEFIWKNASEVLVSNDWTELSHEALMKITVSDELRISEIVLYDACMKWVDAECLRRRIEVTDHNRREVLGDVLFQIRFPTMTQVEFAEISCQSELLTDNECRKIFEHINLDGKDGTNCNFKLKFNRKQRLRPKVTVSRFKASHIDHGWGTLTAYGAVSAVDFQCNKAYGLEGISVYGDHQAGNINVSLKLLDSSGSVLSTINKTVSTDGSKTPVRVDFPQPVMISAGKRYSVVASVDGQNLTYYGKQGSVRVDNEGFVVDFLDSPHGMYRNKPCAEYGRAKKGQIPDLCFKL